MSAGYRDESDAQLAGSDRTPVAARMSPPRGSPRPRHHHRSVRRGHEHGTKISATGAARPPVTPLCCGSVPQHQPLAVSATHSAQIISFGTRNRGQPRGPIEAQSGGYFAQVRKGSVALRDGLPSGHVVSWLGSRPVRGRTAGFRDTVQRAAHTAGRPVRLHHIVVDAHDLPGMARFWTQAPGWKGPVRAGERDRHRDRPERARRHVLHAGHRPQDGQEPRPF